MSKGECDIAVVGGGPAGLIAALTAAKGKINVTLFESKKEIGLSEHCAGLLSVDGLKTLNLLDLPKNVIQNKQIIGSKLYSPSGKMIKVEKSKITAWVVDRSLFNKHLEHLAIRNGVNIQKSSRIVNIKRNKNLLSLELGKNRFSEQTSSKIAILAEGRFPKLNMKLGLESPNREKIVFTTQYLMSNVEDIDSKYVELYQDPNLTSKFFAWIIPINESSAKVGIGTKERPSQVYLNNFISKHPIAKLKLKNAEIKRKMSGAIPLGSYIKKTYTDNAMVVGDAAGQTKPTTGGGVIFGGIAAQFAGEIARTGVLEEEYDKRNLSKYEKLWKKELKLNLTIMKLVRSYINNLNEKETERLFEIIDKPSLKQKISTIGDVDNQKRIVFSLLLEYRLWPFLLKTGIKWIFK